MMHARKLRLTGVITLGVAVCSLLFVAAPALAAAPEAPETKAPSAVTGTTATFKGKLKPVGVTIEKVAYHFAYSPGVGAGCTESGLVAPAEPFPEAEDNKEVSVPVTGLEGNTAYSVCLIAANPAEPAEATQGNTEVFTTLAIKAVRSKASRVRSRRLRRAWKRR